MFNILNEIAPPDLVQPETQSCSSHRGYPYGKNFFPVLTGCAKGLFALAVYLLVSRAGFGQECLECHATAGLDPNRPGLTIATEEFEKSVHGSQGCSGCHREVRGFPHGKVEVPQCSGCHREEAAQQGAGVHGRSVEGSGGGRVGAARCQDCHGPTHAIRPVSDPASPAFRQSLPQTCGKCHSNVARMRQFQLPVVRPLENYSRSVHAKALAEGKGGADCADCHGAHAIYPAADPRSSVYRLRIPDTCGNCHEEIRRTYGESIHGQATARGVTQAAVCTDCHGEHAIPSPTDGVSPGYAANVSMQACSRCHADERLNARYNLPADRVASYQESYHGLSARAGSLRVANCASCHGVHNILPSSDPRSTIAPANLPTTCGKCHPGAGTRFAIGPVHTLTEAPASRAVYWIRRFYLIVIPLTIGFMFLHNLLDLLRKALLRFRAEQARPQLVRMTRNERWQHALLLVSFAVLVWSGFALRFPESFWAQPIVAWEGRWPVRTWLHRVAGLVLMASAALHLLYLATSPAARRRWKNFLPRRTDWAQFRERLAFNLGRRRDRPRLSETSYVEKIEYWAVVWGTALMALTGLVLWSTDFALRHLTTWFLDVASVIHYYEAVLATLAIVVWHFYSVFFDPDQYPMEWTCITGTTDAELWAARRQPTPDIPPPPSKEENKSG